MADKKISALTSLSPVADDDLIVVVDVSDTTMAASGTTKKAIKSELKGDPGEDGASIIDAEFDGDDIKFIKDDTTTVILEDAKIELKGDKGDPGVGATVVTTISDPGSDTSVPSEKAVRTNLNLKADTSSIPVKATGAELNTGTDDAKFATAKAIADSKLSYTDGSETLTNKRINPRLVTATSYTTDTGNSLSVETCDQFEITAQAGALKFNNPGGTPVGGQKLIIRIKDNGTARALTYDTQFRAIGVTLPATTIASKTLYMGFIWNNKDSKWDCVAISQEA